MNISTLEQNPPGNDSRMPCGLLRRLAVMLYDALIVIALLILATAVVMLAGFENLSAGHDPLFTLYLLATWFFYLAWCWRRGGMTIGMRAWRVVIEDESGRRPGWGACAMRFAVSWISTAALGLGFAWSLFDDRKRTWHDMASRSRLLWKG